MRRFLLFVLCWAGIVAPSFAVTSDQAYATCHAYVVSNPVGYGGCSPENCFNSGTAWKAGCPNGTYFNYTVPFSGSACDSGYTLVSQQCVTIASTCTSSQWYNSSTQACVNNPTCASGQTVDSGTHLCVGSGTAPSSGASGGIQYIDVGASNGGTGCTGGCTVPMDTNINGWQYAIGSYVSTADGGGCDVSSGRVLCPFTTTASGIVAGTSDVVASGTAPPSGSVSIAQFSCPTGYSLDTANGVCVSGGSAGTASTSTTAGTAPVAATGACPVGYTEQPDGTCNGAPTNNPVGGGSFCPAGYSLVNGQCTNSGTANGAGTISSSGTVQSHGTGTGSCGGINEPPCSVTPTNASGVDLTTVTAAGTGLISSTSAPSHGWTWSVSLPTATCSTWTIATGGRTLSIDPCPTMTMLRDLFGYVFYILTAWSLFHILFRSEGQAA